MSKFYDKFVQIVRQTNSADYVIISYHILSTTDKIEGAIMGLSLNLTSDAHEAWLWAKLRLTTYTDSVDVEHKSLACRELFDEVKIYCLFIGYPRSGHSLISSLIDAHPNGIMAHRMNSLKFVRAGYSEREIFYLLLRNSQRFAKTGRKLTRYQYDVPHQWQGHFQKLHVIGDQEGKGTTE